MRARNLKPGFFKNEHLLDCEPLARILFEGLWCMADREGRLEDRPAKIKIEILPCDNCDIDALLNQLASKKDDDGSNALIVRYVIDNKRYIQIVNFIRHQKPHIKEQPSTIPEPCEHLPKSDKHLPKSDKHLPKSDKHLPKSDKHLPKSDEHALNPSFLNPSFLNPSKKTFVENSDEFRLAELLFSKIKQHNPGFKPPNLQKWAIHIDKLIRIDKRAPLEIEQVIKWCQADTFWQTNILSTDKLRQKYDQLNTKRLAENNDNKSGLDTWLQKKLEERAERERAERERENTEEEGQ